MVEDGIQKLGLSHTMLESERSVCNGANTRTLIVAHFRRTCCDAGEDADS